MRWILREEHFTVGLVCSNLFFENLEEFVAPFATTTLYRFVVLANKSVRVRKRITSRFLYGKGSSSCLKISEIRSPPAWCWSFEHVLAFCVCNRTADCESSGRTTNTFLLFAMALPRRDRSNFLSFYKCPPPGAAIACCKFWRASMFRRLTYQFAFAFLPPCVIITV